MPKLEPAMPRRKKYPDLAYRHHEFLISDGEIQANGVCNTESRARVSVLEIVHAFLHLVYYLARRSTAKRKSSTTFFTVPVLVERFVTNPARTQT